MTRSEILTEVAGIRQALNSARWVLTEEDIKDIAKIILRATEKRQLLEVTQGLIHGLNKDEFVKIMEIFGQATERLLKGKEDE